MRLYLSRIEGPPPKRNAPGSNPGKRAKKCREIKVSRHYTFYCSLIFLRKFYYFLDSKIRSNIYHIPTEILLITISRKSPFC